MDTIVVTGGAGFIGSNFVRHALGRTEARVVVLDKLTYAGNLESLADVSSHPRYAFVQADIADREAVRAAFREHGVVPMRADWTTQDPEITRALATFGRSGVPLAVLYGTDPTAEPLVQPTILTPAIVLSALREGMGS